jgi:hypothetical protein
MKSDVSITYLSDPLSIISTYLKNFLKAYYKDKFYPQMEANILLQMYGYHFQNLILSQGAMQTGVLKE